MDPASAFGLASSIVQVITFTSDIISKTRQLHHSAQHSLIQNSELASIAQTLKLHNHGIRTSLRTKKNPSRAEKDLFELSERVHDLCNQLITTVEGLKTHDSATRWDSFLQALRSVWKEKDIVDLTQRLDRYRAQIDSSLLAFMQEQLEALTRDTRNRDERIEQNLTRILASLDKQKNWQAEAFSAARESMGATKANAVTSLGLVSASLTTGAEEDRERLMKLRILESLNFVNMQDRYEHIPEAYQKTFEWVFKDSSGHTTENSGQRWDSFNDWLAADNPLYWITGKPGAGKSTLMKFLSNNSRLRSRLKVWRGDIPLYTGRFFFWNSGTTMQMSKFGLLRSLLYQTVSKFPNEIPNLFATRWQYQELFGHDDRPWSWSELSQAFSKLVSDQKKSFFFLIDGLDEFGGDCDELVSYLLQALRLGSNLKLCVASRPWLVFEDAFKLQPSLRVEHLTIADVRLFTSERLTANTMFARLQSLDPKSANVLIEDVTQKASGVFLWVALVVKSLLEGLRDGDSFGDLQTRLLQLPPDLEALFKKIVADLEPDYFEQASHIFQAARAAQLPWKVMQNTPMLGFNLFKRDIPHLTLLSISFIDEDVQQALNTKYTYASNTDEQIFRAERMRRRLHSRCKGLLDVPSFDKHGPEARVEYLHRTVKDFLEENGTRGFLTLNVFDAHLALCAAFLRHAKLLDPTTLAKETVESVLVAHLLKEFLIQCHWLEKQGRGDYVPFLEEMDRVAEAIYKLAYSSQPYWTKSIYLITVITDETLISSLFDYAVVLSLTHYVKKRLADGFSFNKNPNRQSLSKHVLKNGTQSMADVLGLGNIEMRQADADVMIRRKNRSSKVRRVLHTMKRKIFFWWSKGA